MRFPLETTYQLVTASDFHIFVSQPEYCKKQKEMKKKQTVNSSAACKVRITAIKDTMEILSGKWKFHILGTLMTGGKMRFMDLLREVDGVAAKMFSKELQDM